MKRAEKKDPLADITAQIRDVDDQISRVKSFVKKFDADYREEQQALNERLESMQRSIQALHENLTKVGKSYSVLEKKMDSVRVDSSAGIAVAIGIFGVLFIVSFFF